MEGRQPTPGPKYVTLSAINSVTMPGTMATCSGHQRLSHEVVIINTIPLKYYGRRKMAEMHNELLSFREMHYAVKAHRNTNLAAYFLFFAGFFLILVSAVFELFMLFDARRLDSQVIGASLIICLIAFFGKVLINTSRTCKYILHKERALVQGPLRKVDIHNPNGPTASFYFIGNCQLIMPPEADCFCELNVEQYTEASGVILTRETTSASNSSLFKISQTVGFDGPKLVVLNYYDRVDIDGFFNRHGLRYFTYLLWIRFATGAIFMTMLGIGLAWFTSTELNLKYPTATCIGLMVANCILFWVIDVQLENWVCKRKNYGDTTHLERLSGKV